MKVVKPLCLGLMARPFEARQSCHMSVSVVANVPLLGEPKLHADHLLWKLLPSVLGSAPILDEGMPKSRAEMLVAGRAFPPGGPATTCPVEVTLGGLHRELSVIGDRYWQNDVPSAPEPFESLDITWERAFGGPGFAANPEGRGFAPIERDGVPVHPLPNVEDPAHPIRAIGDRPAPAGFRALDVMNPARAQHRGSYDQAWVENVMPSPPADEDWRLWNMAPESQQQDAAFVGDEPYRILHMHPDHPLIEGRLPNLRGRAFAIRGEVKLEDNKVRPPGELEEIPLRLMTVWLMPEHDRAVMLFNGVMDIVEDDGRDVHLLLLAAERIGEERDVAHYSDVIDKRYDPEWGAMHALFDDDLVPADLPVSVDMLDPELRSEWLLKANALRGAERKREEARERALEQGMSLEELGLAEPVTFEESPPLRELPAKVRELKAQREELEARAKKEKQDALAEAERLCLEHGVDYESIRQSMDQEKTGPPEFSAESHRELLESHLATAQENDVDVPWLAEQASDEEKLAVWREQEKHLLEGYRVGAHLQKPAPARDAEASARAREHVLAGIAAGESFDRRDLTGVDLSGADLSGANLSGALMESVDLSGAQLDGARLEGTVLAHANLTDASLKGAKLMGANLGAATLLRAEGDAETDLTGANLTQTKGDGARLKGARLSSAMLIRASFDDADFSGCQLDECLLIEASFARAKFAGASLTSLIFMDLDLSAIDFSDAKGDNVSFVDCKLAEANFARAEMNGARFVSGCTLHKADFRHAQLARANFRNAIMPGADLSGCDLTSADFSEADLTGANLYRVLARGSSWMRTVLQSAQLMNADLMQANFMKADIRAADLRGANLFSANFARVRGDRTTQLEGANRVRSNVHPRRRDS